MQEKTSDIIVIGAGAAGLMAAIAAAEAGASVQLLESMSKPGRKLRITGKGRCNITNNNIIAEYMRQIHPLPKFCRPMFSRFFVPDALQFFHRIGVATVEERGRRVFPQSQRALDVVRALNRHIETLGVALRCDTAAAALQLQNGRCSGVLSKDGRSFTAKAVILTTGGKSYPATGSTGDGYRLAAEAGHHIVEPFPALVPLETRGILAPELQGLAMKNVSAELWTDGKKRSSRFGEMLFTHFGLSGPIILDMSREAVAAYRQGLPTEIRLDCKPALDVATLDKRLIRELEHHGKAKLKTMLKTLLPLSMIIPFCREAGLDPDKYCHQINATERHLILHKLKDLRFEIRGYRSWDEAIVTAGGVELKEVNPSTMESKVMPGLFFAGEILDLDASTGGFNLQIAWSSGYVAGKSAAQIT
jgi:predicted Rossmann fold flavoprotein